jgi:hypothetical protein
MKTTNTAIAHIWRFFRAGGLDQVRLDRGSDIMSLGELDQKLWVALACPTTGLHFDARTLDLIDTDHDGRVRVTELLAAIRWTGGLLRNSDDLLKGSPSLPLSAISDASDEGRMLLSCGREVLASLGKPDAGVVSVDDTVEAVKAFAARPINGDGILVEESASDEATRALIRDIAACCGTEQDRSGKPGISQAAIDRFFAEAQGFADWWKKSEGDTQILPLGDGTAAAFAAVKTVKVKVDDYFARCRLAAFDGRATAALNRAESDFLALAAKDLTITSSEIANLPLARVEAGAALALGGSVNPAWADGLAALRSAAVKPLVGDLAALTGSAWQQVRTRLAAYEQWQAEKAGALVEKLGISRVREALAGAARTTLSDLVARDKAQEGTAAALASLEKLVRFHRDLQLLVVNFVNFKDFYDRGAPAIFQVGRLYLDQRSCDLCLRVEETTRHAIMAGLAGTYLAYCECTRKGSGEKMHIVAAFTDGDSDNLMLGRNGVFYDRAGRDWDATITRIVDNPISLRQAFWSPYKKFVRMIEEQVAKRAAAAEASSSAKLQSVAAGAATADKLKPADPRKVDVGTVAALGVAFGAIGTFLAAMLGYLTGIIKLGPFAILAAALGVVALISGPSLILAYIKLRQRNLGPILDACGWAVNARARISVPFGAELTHVAKLPPGSQRDLRDPFAEKKSLWPKLIAAAFVLYIVYALLSHMGFVHEWTGGRLGEKREIKKTSAVEQMAPGIPSPPTLRF